MKVFEELRASFARGITRPLSWRIEQLKAIEAFLTENESLIIEALKKDLGKSKAEAWNTEVGFLLKDVRHTRKNLKRWLKPRKVSTPAVAKPGRSKLLLEPLGTVLIMGAWNYPMQLSLSPLIAAIAAGNTAILKPSEVSANSARIMHEILTQYLDPEAVAVLNGDASLATELLQLPFDHIFYTGGNRVGKIVMRAAAEHLTPVTLELGGKSPVLVSKKSDIKVTARRIAWGKWMNAGQTCIAPDYVLVEKEAYQPLVDALLQSIKDFYTDDPQRSKDYGRIINEQHFRRLLTLMDGQTLINDSDFDRSELYIKPLLVDNPASDSAIMQEEIFGPLLPIIRVDSFQQGIDFVRQREKPLACYAFSNDKAEQADVEHQISTGNLCINDTMMFMLNDKLPFGGVGNSGMGRYHGEFGLRTFSHEKPVMTRSFHLDVALRYPPFSSQKLKWLKKLM
ncbi:aldehyde dehydrogenase family protein [Aliidiomarina minuta]|uniref:Aldehyde dehydrogenase n=1 Tax=Aliidiomarina minuta TaxID=880057 RepID=A0A432W155_9GAMM|nr:aldehyde dehydrogenase family protein [Aliidiomarina minuta]RUO22937.1 aldehyde dehydrogenase family protein [Aliidiomarina minuta]